MSITRQEWADWLRSDVTQAVVEKLTEKREAALEAMLNADGDTLEGIALIYFAYRNKLEGLDEFLDLDNLGDWIVEETEE